MNCILEYGNLPRVLCDVRYVIDQARSRRDRDRKSRTIHRESGRFEGLYTEKRDEVVYKVLYSLVYGSTEQVKTPVWQLVYVHELC